MIGNVIITLETKEISMEKKADVNNILYYKSFIKVLIKKN